MDTLQLNIKFKYFTLILFGLLTLTCCFLYFKYSSDFKIEIQLGIIGAGVGLATTIYTAINTNFIYRIEKEKFEFERKKLSKEAIEYWLNSETQRSIGKAGTALLKIENLENDKLRAYLVSNPEDQAALINLLNYSDYISLLINDQLANEEILKKFFKELFKSNYLKLKPLIALTKKEINCSTAFVEYEVLIAKWI